MKRFILPLILFFQSANSDAQSWSVLQVPNTRNLYSCWFDSNQPDTGIAVGWYMQAFDLLPFAFTTTDGGNSINNISLFQIYFYAAQDVTFTNSYNGIVVGNGIIQTTDGGNNWNIVEDATAMQGGRLYNVMFTNGTDGYAVGQRYDFNYQFMEGMIYKTNNAGGSWTNVTVSQEASNENTELHAVCSTGNGIVYTGATNTIGSGSTLFKSTDDGVTWNPLPFTISVWALHFVSADTGFAATATGLFKTTDAGNTWNNIQVTGSALHTVHIKQGAGFAAGENGILYQTTDNGQTWASMSCPVSNTIERVFVINPNLAYAVGASGTFMKYTSSTGVIHEENNISDFKVCLLPHSNIFAQWNSTSNEGSVLEVINLQGNIMESLKIPGNGKTEKKIIINMQSISSGIYLLRITTGNKAYSRKIMVTE